MFILEKNLDKIKKKCCTYERKRNSFLEILVNMNSHNFTTSLYIKATSKIFVITKTNVLT